MIIAYMVIVSYQFNAGGAVLEVITGDKEAKALQVGDKLNRDQLGKGWVRYISDKEQASQAQMEFTAESDDGPEVKGFTVKVDVVNSADVIAARKAVKDEANHFAIKSGNYVRLKVDGVVMDSDSYVVASLPKDGAVMLVEPTLTAANATIIAAIFIIV